MYRFLLWLIPAVEKFPRSQKFLLGDRIQNAGLEVLERLIEATYTRAAPGSATSRCPCSPAQAMRHVSAGMGAVRPSPAARGSLLGGRIARRSAGSTVRRPRHAQRLGCR